VAAKGPRDVVARYGNWFQGDDDLFAHCLILRDGKRARLFQGLQAVTVEVDRASEPDHRQLVDLLDVGIPPDWGAASYQGYNFITDPEGPDAREIAVYSVSAADSGELPGSYFVAPETSDIGELVKALSQVD
jgi:hypothetical protein